MAACLCRSIPQNNMCSSSQGLPTRIQSLGFRLGYQALHMTGVVSGCRGGRRCFEGGRAAGRESGNHYAMRVRQKGMRSDAGSFGRIVTAYAPHDLVSALARVVGFRDRVYRQRAVDLLDLSLGDCVVELGCGTGRNFPLLERAVGSAGRIVAVDFSSAMIARARARAARRDWSNIEFVHSDAARCSLPRRLDGVLATYALVAVPEYDQVIERACGALSVGKRCVVLDQKLPRGPASRLVPLVDLLSRPIPYSQIVAGRRIWDSIRQHFGNVRMEEFYFGFVYLAVGEKRGEDFG